VVAVLAEELLVVVQVVTQVVQAVVAVRQQLHLVVRVVVVTQVGILQ
jgi:hypothetical protein